MKIEVSEDVIGYRVFEPEFNGQGYLNSWRTFVSKPYPTNVRATLELLFKTPGAERKYAAVGFSFVQEASHKAAKRSGWWTNLDTGKSLIPSFNVPEKLMLIVSEIAEAMEGHRKNLMDDKLPHRKMIEVELADAVIRIGDLAGALGLDLGGAIAEKLEYNANRADHKPENRKAEGGKAY